MSSTPTTPLNPPMPSSAETRPTVEDLGPWSNESVEADIVPIGDLLSASSSMLDVVTLARSEAIDFNPEPLATPDLEGGPRLPCFDSWALAGQRVSEESSRPEPAVTPSVAIAQPPGPSRSLLFATVATLGVVFVGLVGTIVF